MILKYYGLREQPFGVAPNPRFIYQGPEHREALASLIYAIESNAGFAALIGRAGLGKTTLIFHLLDYFRQTARTAVVFNTQCSKHELLRYILAEFGETQLPGDVVLLYEHFRDILVREASQGRRVIIIIDEAQNLELEALESVRLLNNFETPESKLLHIILVGQQQLAAKLMHPSMEQLLQRITIICRLAKFEDVESIERYINHRMRTAGYCRPTPLFSADAIHAILRESDGVPRRINRLCFNALLLGCALDRLQIDSGIIDEVARDLDLGELVPGGLPADLEETHDTASKVHLPGSKNGALFEMPAIKPQPAQSLPTAIGSSTATTYAGTVDAGTVVPISRPPRTAAFVETPPVLRQNSLRAENPLRVRIDEPPPKPETPAPPMDAPKDVAVPQVARPALDAIKPVPDVPRSKIRIPSAAPKPVNKRKSPYKPLGSISKIPVVMAISFATVAAGAWFIAPGPLFRIQLRSSQIAALQPPAQEQENQQHSDLPQQTAAAATKPVVAASSKQSETSTSHPIDSDDPEASTAYNIWPGGTAGNIINTQPLPTSEGEAGRHPGSILQRVMPVYPPDAEANKIQGRVVIHAVVGSNGRVTSVQATEGPKLLADAAVNAVQRWIYEPPASDTDKKLIFDFKLRP